MHSGKSKRIALNPEALHWTPLINSYHDNTQDTTTTGLVCVNVSIMYVRMMKVWLSYIKFCYITTANRIPVIYVLSFFAFCLPGTEESDNEQARMKEQTADGEKQAGDDQKEGRYVCL